MKRFINKIKGIYYIFYSNESYFKKINFFDTSLNIETALPWLTIPAIKFLQKFLKKYPESKILEVGGGIQHSILKKMVSMLIQSKVTKTI